jgi:uncharacterized small protein (DUF1192 family)
MSGNELNVAVKELEDRIAELEDELCDAQQVPWPEWADKILKLVRSYSGYDGYDDATDGVDIVGEVEEAFSELYSEAERSRAALSPQPVTKPAMGGGWMPIDTVPKDGTEVFIYPHKRVSKWVEGEEAFGDVSGLSGSWDDDFDAYWVLQGVTHWMPLPTPPSTTGGEEP